MNTKFKSIFKTITLSLGALLLVTTATYAIGTLTPSGTPGDATHYTLNDIYQKILNHDTYEPEDSVFSTPTGTPTASFATLTEIWNELNNQPDLLPENILEGKTILGVDGTLSAGIAFPTEWSADHPDGYVDWATAVSYCENLDENGTGWRLPSYIELVNAYLTGVSGFAGGDYWSSTEFPNATGNAYNVYMSNGNAYDSVKTNPDVLARCAR